MQTGTMTKTIVAVVLAAGLLVAGCAARQVRIAELKDQPTRYNDQTIRVTGMVTDSYGIPLVPFQLYNVDDGSGEISVVSKSGTPPARGTKVEVRGRLSEVAVLGGKSIGLHITEEDRRVVN